MFQAVPLLIAGGSTWLTHNWLTRASLESPDYVPRFTEKGWDARAWLLGIGLGSLVLGPMWPLLSTIGVGAGVAAAVNYSTMDQVKTAVSKFVGRQPKGALEDQSVVEQITSLLQTADIPIPTRTE